MIKVAIIDDHAVLRAGIESILTPEMKCILSGCSLDDFYEFEEKDQIDVMVLDLNLSDLPGSAVITNVLKVSPDMKIVIYSMRDTVGAISSCYGAGAYAFVSKLSDVTMLLDAIRTVNEEEYFYEPGRVESIATFAHAAKKLDPREILTPSECNIFILLAEGKNKEEIADTLNISIKSVKNKTTVIKQALKIPLNSFAQKAKEFNLIS